MLTLQITWLSGSYQQIGKHKTRNSSSQKFTPTAGAPRRRRQMNNLQLATHLKVSNGWAPFDI